MGFIQMCIIFIYPFDHKFSSHLTISIANCLGISKALSRQYTITARISKTIITTLRHSHGQHLKNFKNLDRISWIDFPVPFYLQLDKRKFIYPSCLYLQLVDSPYNIFCLEFAYFNCF